MNTRVYVPPSFKAERVQLTAEAAPACLAAERLAEELEALPGWRLTAQQDAIYRLFRFPAAGSAQLFARLALALADELGHPPTLRVRGPRVSCQLSTPWAGGITGRDFEMARRLSLLS
jgi:4a-hydroxytetrahydrobiopterin dehydratase